MSEPKKREPTPPAVGTPLGVHRLGGRAYMLTSDVQPQKKADQSRTQKQQAGEGEK